MTIALVLVTSLLLACFAAPTPSYTYREGSLDLVLGDLGSGPLVVTWRDVDEQGRIKGKRHKSTMDAAPKDGRLSLSVGLGAGHEVIVRSKTIRRRFLATRGTWFVLPRESSVATDRIASEAASALTSVTDTILSPSFSARVEEVRARAPLEVGRTFGMDLGTTVKPDRRDAIVIVGGATQQGALVTITETFRGAQRYWDHPLNLDAKTKRYVLPLSSFSGRAHRAKRPLRIDAISVRTLETSKKGDRLWIDAFALSNRPARISTVRRRRNGIDVQVVDRLKAAKSVLHTKTSSVVVTKSSMRLRGDSYSDVAGVWLCRTRFDGITSCDPPDAPITLHPIPPLKPLPWVVDAFAGTTPLNALRKRTVVYTSTIGFDATIISKRVPGSLRLEDPDAQGLSYVGYATPVSPRLPSYLKTLVVEVRGAGPAERVRVGLRDRRGREPKVNLDGALTDWRTIEVPLSKLKQRGARYDAITLTMEADPATQWLQIRRIALQP